MHAAATALEQRCLDIAATLADTGWCITPDFLPPEQVAELRAEAHTLWSQAAFRRAGVGQGERHTLNNDIRSDHVLWLEHETASTAQRHYLDTLEQLRSAINQSLYLGLFEFEGHLAIYPPGSYYRRHLDQFRGNNLRTVTTILYLNDAWGRDDGGELRFYPEPERLDRYLDIPPLGGQLVSFLSDRYPHEVLPARRERISITGWFKRRGDTVV